MGNDQSNGISSDSARPIDDVSVDRTESSRQSGREIAYQQVAQRVADRIIGGAKSPFVWLRHQALQSSLAELGVPSGDREKPLRLSTLAVDVIVANLDEESHELVLERALFWGSRLLDGLVDPEAYRLMSVDGLSPSEIDTLRVRLAEALDRTYERAFAGDDLNVFELCVKYACEWDQLTQVDRIQQLIDVYSAVSDDKRAYIVLSGMVDDMCMVDFSKGRFMPCVIKFVSESTRTDLVDQLMTRLGELEESDRDAISRAYLGRPEALQTP